MTDSPTDTFQHWSDYWSTGALTSLPQDFAFNYDGEVAEFWQTIFSTLPDPARVLDVCTGNGPIALMAAQWAEREKRDCHIQAADAARPQPGLIMERQPALGPLIERIEFLAETPIESLSLPEASLDLVTSQYGLEYCDLDQAAPLLARFLKPDGRLVMLAHAADSDMLATMQAEKADYDLLEQARVFSLLHSWERGQLGDLDFRERLDRSGRKLAADRRRASSPLISQTLQSMAGLVRLPPARLRMQRPLVSDFRRQMVAGQRRLQDMLRVNRMIVDDPHWHRPFEAAGLALEDSRDVHYRNQHRVGQAWVWRKPKP